MMAERSQNGSVLVFVLVATGLVMGLALLTGAMVVSRARLSEDAMSRARLRAEAVSALAQMAWQIDADTNGVDHLQELWAKGLSTGAVEVHVEDERARLPFQTSGLPALVHWLDGAPNLDADGILAEANRLRLWWGAAQGCDTNRVLAAEEELLSAPLQEPAAVAARLPRLTVLGDGKINVNTANREVLIAMLLDAGGDAVTAERLYLRIAQSRQRGEWFESLDLADVRKLLAGDGDALTTKELGLLQRLAPKFTVESGLFRLTATAERDGVHQTVQCVYERSTGRIHRWLEF